MATTFRRLSRLVNTAYGEAFSECRSRQNSPRSARSSRRFTTSRAACFSATKSIPRGAPYCNVDSTAIAQAQAAGATNITPVETTHGVIR